MRRIISEIQVISLCTHTHRREHIINQFKKYNIDFNFFDAITRNEATQVANKMSFDIEDGALTLGELGCFMSHVSLWQMMLDEKLPYLIIFEDDVVLAESSSLIINSVKKAISEFDILKLETMKEKVLLGESIHNLLHFNFFKIKSPHMGTAAYIISNECAKKALKKLKSTVLNKPIDHYMFIDFLEDFSVNQLYPAVGIQEDVINTDNSLLASDLEVERRAKMTEPKQQLSFNEKMTRELRRIGKQLSLNNLKEKRRLKIKYKDYIVVPFEGE